jgi:hypothetical protein
MGLPIGPNGRQNDLEPGADLASGGRKLRTIHQGHRVVRQEEIDRPLA